MNFKKVSKGLHFTILYDRKFENLKMRSFNRLLTWEPDDVLNTFIIPNGENYQACNDGTHQIVFNSRLLPRFLLP